MPNDATVSLHSGNVMPALGLGTWQPDHDIAATIEDAIRSGWIMIDTSGDYGTQPGIRKGIKRSEVARDYLFITTKVETTDNAYEATRENLRQLGTDYANLVLIHHPPRNKTDEILWRGLIKAKHEGLTKDIGVSNYSIGQMERLMRVSNELPVVNQIEWSPFGHSKDMLHFCKAHNIVIQAYSPLTQGQRLGDDRLKLLSDRYRKSPAQILIRWNIQLGTVPIIKASSREHLQANLEVFDFDLSPEDMRLLDGMNEMYSSLGILPYK